MPMWSHPTRRRFCRGILAAGSFALAGPRSAAALHPGKGPILFGVFPYLPALQIGEQFGPLASTFAALCNQPVSLQTKASFPAFRHLLLEGRYDIALLHPFFYADACEVQDYRALGRLREDLAAIIVAPVGRRLHHFGDLRGETIAAPPRMSAVTELLMQEIERQQLTGPGGIEVVPNRTKVACLQAVANGTAAACALPGFAMNQLERFKPVALEGKFMTRSIPGIVLTAHGRLGDPMVDALRRKVLGLDDDPEQRQLLAPLGSRGFVPVAPGEYHVSRLRPKVDS
jgi:ABC-type phosphate/phosphonate transport system substrate-binding protein